MHTFAKSNNPSYKSHINGFFLYFSSFSQKGQHKESLITLERAIELDPDNGDAHTSMAAVYNDLGLYKQAEYYYNKAIEIRPTDGEAYNNLGFFYNHQGK